MNKISKRLMFVAVVIAVTSSVAFALKPQNPDGTENGTVGPDPLPSVRWICGKAQAEGEVHSGNCVQSNITPGNKVDGAITGTGDPVLDQ